MTELSLTIEGNHKDPYGNPVPYTRVLKQKWRADATNYAKWLSYVRSKVDGVYGHSGRLRSIPAELLKKNKRRQICPIWIEKDHAAEIHIKIYWADEHHGDADNILKGIEDALFDNDKEVIKGSWETIHGQRGMVAVNIKIY